MRRRSWLKILTIVSRCATEDYSDRWAAARRSWRAALIVREAGVMSRAGVSRAEERTASTARTCI